MGSLRQWLLAVTVCLLAAGASAQNNGTQNNGASASKEPKTFQHSDTGFDLLGSHGFLACESCHIGGRFSGTPRECEICHSLNGFINATAKPATHIPSTDNCDICHEETFWDDIPRLEHSEVFGTCSTCHNNFVTEGKDPDHLITNRECDSCHSDIAWLPAVFDHDAEGIVGNCFSCHNGVISTGKSADHINTNNQCELCHFSTSSFLDNVIVDHVAVLGTCDSCHNGVIAGGRSPDHPPVRPQFLCDACHFSTIDWAEAVVYNHEGITVGCFECHNRWAPKPADHIPSNNVCEACHFSTEDFRANVIVDHDAVLGTCSSCHNNIIAEGKADNHIPTVEECDTCHSTDAWLPVQFTAIGQPPLFVASVMTDILQVQSKEGGAKQ